MEYKSSEEARMESLALSIKISHLHYADTSRHNKTACPHEHQEESYDGICKNKKSKINVSRP